MSPARPTTLRRGVAVIVCIVLLSLVAVADARAAAPNDAAENARAPLVQVGPTEWQMPAESAEEREARVTEIEARRSRPFVILHRGASYVAPENTPAAFDAALDMGADGWEFDVRRTRDNALIVFHDPVVYGRMLDGMGVVDEMYYEELLLHPFLAEDGGKLRRFHVPTLAETLARARERRALLFIEIKSPGVDAEVAGMLTAADLWDHVVYVHERNSEAVRSGPRYREAAWLADLTFSNRKAEGAQDAEFEVVRRALSGEGQHIIAGDARVVLEALGREAGGLKQHEASSAAIAVNPPSITRLVNALFGLDPFLQGRLAAARLVNYYGDVAAGEIAQRMRPGLPCSVRTNIAWALGMVGRYYPETIDDSAREVLIGLGTDPEAAVRAEAARALGFCARPADIPVLIGLASEGYSPDRTFEDEVGVEAGRTALTQVRAAAAEALGRLGDTRPSVIEALEALVRAPAAHYPFGLATSYDGCVAARALSRLEARGSVPVLVRLLESDGEDLKAANPQLTGRAAAMLPWHDIQAQGQAARAIALLGGSEDLRSLVSPFTAPEAGGGGRASALLDPIVTSLAARRDMEAREACSETLFSPMGSVRREAFFRLLSASDPALTAQAVAGALSSHLEEAEDLTGCAMALHLLGLLGHRSPEVAAAVAAWQAAADEVVRERAQWCHRTLYGSD